MANFSAEQVRTQVNRFWEAYRTRSAKAMEEMYFTNAVLFSASSQRSEHAQLALARRLREFSDGNVSTKADIRAVDVQIFGNTAIASYDYQFSRSKRNRDGGRENLEVPFALGTQVFRPGPGGELRIVHEHFGAAEQGRKSVVGKDAAGPAENEFTAPAVSERGSAAEWIPARDAIISAEEVRGEVQNFWKLFESKSKDELEHMYSSSAIVFAATVKRGELAGLASRRREREFFGPQSSISCQAGPADVQIVERDLAIASYTFRWRMVRVMATGKVLDLDIPLNRASQVFQKDEKGVLRILHENKSAAVPAIIKELTN